MAAPELTIVGRVRRAHGIHGELVIEPLTDVPDAVFAPGRRVFAGTADGDPSPDGRTLVVEESRPFKGGGWIVAFGGIADRNEAERWRQRYVLAPKSELTPVAAHEVYLHDLFGMHSLARRHPAYRWEHNVGYATQDHITGLATAGITPHHRRSFMRIRQLSFDFDGPTQVIVDIPIEAMMGDVSGEPGAITTLEPEPNESIVAPGLVGG